MSENWDSIIRKRIKDNANDRKSEEEKARRAQAEAKRNVAVIRDAQLKFSIVMSRIIQLFDEEADTRMYVLQGRKPFAAKDHTKFSLDTKIKPAEGTSKEEIYSVLVREILPGTDKVLYEAELFELTFKVNNRIVELHFLIPFEGILSSNSIVEHKTVVVHEIEDITNAILDALAFTPN